MGKTLVIAEKPSVGRDLTRALPGAFQKHEGYLESDTHVVTWAVGHLVQLAEPDEYDAKYKKWRMADLPIVPDRFKLVVRDERSRKQMTVITRMLKRDDVDEVINACDAGREGELIFAWTFEKAGAKKPVQRLWLSSMTSKAIKEAFAALRPASEFELLEQAARSRSEADWIVGMNATRAATIRLRSSFDGAVSLGRVQTPTLAIIARREEEIRAFVPGAVLARGRDVRDRRRPAVATSGRFHAGAQPRLKTAEEADGDRRRPCRAARATITKLEKTKRVREGAAAVRPHVAAARGQHALRVLRAADAVRGAAAVRGAQGPHLPAYELALPAVGHDRRDQADRRAAWATHREYAQGRGLRDRAGRAAARPRDQRREGHRPPRDHPDQLRAQARQALRRRPARSTTWSSRRFLAVFHPDAVFENTRLETTVAEHVFRTRGRVLLEAGWRGVYGEARESAASDDDEARRPAAPEAGPGRERLACCEVGAEEKITQPPRRYSDASLLGAMETAGKLVDDDELREAMKDSGIGTPATRAAIIERLIDVGYVERDGRSLVCTEKGLGVIRLLDDHALTSPSLTGDWEHRLSKIEEGDEARREFMADIAAVRRRDGHDARREAQGSPHPAGEPRPLPRLRPRHRREPQGLLLLVARGPGLRLRHLEAQGRQDPRRPPSPAS